MMTSDLATALGAVILFWGAFGAWAVWDQRQRQAETERLRAWSRRLHGLD